MSIASEYTPVKTKQILNTYDPNYSNSHVTITTIQEASGSSLQKIPADESFVVFLTRP
jgi:hypothetical protein